MRAMWLIAGDGHHSPPAADSRRRVALGCVLWAGVHSALAARPSKALARRLVGSRMRYGCYRLAYVVLSTVMLLGFVRWFNRLPDRELYRVPSPWSWLLHTVQALSLGWLCAGIAAAGLGRSTGISQVRALLHGSWPEPEPEDQGPPMLHGHMLPRGPFRVSRHPNNLVVFPFFWLMPRMTVNRVVLAALASGYAVLGSMHEDARLLRAYGAAYRRYQQQVPFLVPVRLGRPTRRWRDRCRGDRRHG